MDKNFILERAHEWVYSQFQREASGHDYWHIYRVVSLSKEIAAKEGGDPFITELAALLHDIPDEKLGNTESEGVQAIENFLKAEGLESVERVIDVILTVSFKGGLNLPPSSIEGKVVQDADRLDAIGAIGIARCFTFAGSRNQLIYDPNVEPRKNLTYEAYRKGTTTAINHFYEKLLKLKDMMQTETGKRMANERHAFMEHYLKQFYLEWEGLI